MPQQGSVVSAQGTRGKRNRRRAIAVVLFALAWVMVFGVSEVATWTTKQTLAGSTWQLASYDYLIFDGRNGDHRSDLVAIARPQRYSLEFDPDGTALLTADCYRSTWTYSVEHGIGHGFLLGMPGLGFALQQDAQVVPGCETASDPALDVTGGLVSESVKVFLARTAGFEFRSGELVLLRPLATDPFFGSYPDERPLEQVFVSAAPTVAVT